MELWADSLLEYAAEASHRGAFPASKVDESFLENPVGDVIEVLSDIVCGDLEEAEILQVADLTYMEGGSRRWRTFSDKWPYLTQAV